jgi:hypothetical protein
MRILEKLKMLAAEAEASGLPDTACVLDAMVQAIRENKERELAKLAAEFSGGQLKESYART